MQNGLNMERLVSVLCEAHAIVANAQAKLSRLTLQFPDIAFAGFRETMQCRENSHGSVALQLSHICAGRFRPCDLSHVLFLDIFKVVRCEPKIGQHFFIRD
jgi:hypothetical protein